MNPGPSASAPPSSSPGERITTAPAATATASTPGSATASTTGSMPAATASMLPTVIHLPPRRTLVPWLVALALVTLLFVFRQALTLLVVAFGVAYVLAPAVRWAERFRIPRPITIALVMLFGTALVVASAAVLIPELLRQSESLVKSAPRYSAYIQSHWIPYLRDRWHLRIPPRTEDALAQLGLRAGAIAPRIGALLNGTLEYTIAFLELIFKGLIVFALAFYILLDFDHIREHAFDLVPYRMRDRANAIMREIDDSLRHFVNGQLLVMVILGGLYGIGLGVLGVPAWWAIGLFSGLISFVPYLGFFVALGLAIFMSALQGAGLPHVAAVMGVMSGVHILDLTLITPRILGGRAKVPPVVVILALIAGGSVFGFVGILVAIPAASVARVLLREIVAYYKTTGYFLARSTGSAIYTTPPITSIPGAIQTAELGAVLLTNPPVVRSAPPEGTTSLAPPAPATSDASPRPSRTTDVPR